MDWRAECRELAEEIQIDLRHWGDCPSLAIFEMRPFRQEDGSWGIFRTLVSYDTEPQDLEYLRGQPHYAGCEFEGMLLSDILQIALYQGT